MLSYLATSRRDTREIRPCHSLSRAQHRTAPYTEHYLSNTSLTVGLSLYLSLYSSFPPSISHPFISSSTCPFLSLSLSSPSLPPSHPPLYLSLSVYFYLSACLSLSLSLPLPLCHAGRRNPSSSASLFSGTFSLLSGTTIGPCQRERDAAIENNRQRRRR